MQLGPITKMCFIFHTFSSSAVVHVSAHMVNVVNFSSRYSDDFPALNLARYRGEVELLKYVDAAIGHLLSN